MKKLILFAILLSLCTLQTWGQSSMTDDAVAEYIQKELAKGTSQAQIVTSLMQRGVDITQIRRIRKAYQRQTEASGMGMASQSAQDGTRLRTNNTKMTREQTLQEETLRNASTTQRQQGLNTWQRQYNQNSSDFMQMQDELGMMAPADTILLYKMMMEEKEKQQKRVFGRDIFNNKDLTFEPAMNIATPQNYLLGPGDAVIIDIYGASQKSINTTVSPDGDIVIEGFGPIQVSGLSVAQANSRIKSQLGARYQSSQVKVSLGQTRTISINVMGEVTAPGTYTLSAFASVFHALYMAGGTNDLGTLRNIKIYRGNRLVSTCDIYDYILNGKMTGNVRLADGDVIIVGPYDCLVTVSGKVKRPMIYEMRKNESLESVLRYAGGFSGDAYTKAVRVNRKTGREYAVFNVDEFDMSSFRVADGDSVSVDSILPRYQNTVEVKGAVFRPGMYQLGSGINSVRTLIDHAEGVLEHAFTNRAVIHRLKADRTLEVVSVNLAGIIDGTVADVPLQENDVLFVPSKEEAMTEQTITIHGEVHYPGVYKYAEHETLEDFVLQAGGLTDKASPVKVDVARRIVNPMATEQDSITARTYSFTLKEGFVVDGTPGFELQPFDHVYVRQSPGYSDPQNVSIEGEVMFAGSYTLSHRNMHLTDLLQMAGGPTDQAYVKGARLMRRPNEAERTRMEAAFKMQQEQLQQQLLELAVSSNNASLQQSGQSATQTQLQKFEVPSSFPVGIELDKAIANPESDANIELREGDRLILPRYTATVKINGSVMYPNTVAYQKGKSAKYYINAAGGFSQNAKKSKAYIIYMNGMVSKVSQGAKVLPGCEIVVPGKIRRRMSTAEVMSMGTSLSSIAAMIATIANN